MNPTRVEVIDVILPLERSEDPDAQRAAVASALKLPVSRIATLRLRKHSIDARKKQVKIQLRFEASIDAPLPEEGLPEPNYPILPLAAKRVIIVGAGPAGLFAALRLIELGVKPIILERGKNASARRFDLAPILRHGIVNEESNYCFGEGGAGTFSDGKLYTRATKRGPVAKIYETFVAHGAPSRILIDSHPHIGSNLLPRVVMAMRESIIRAGGEVHFESRVVDLLVHNQRAVGVLTEKNREFLGEAIILATGHSARDVYQMLVTSGVQLEQKPFAVGVRIEHPQALIDSNQYHYPRGQERPHLLPAASYRLATKIKDRGVHSFCMCPGGFIVPAATSNDEVVVNGMSLSRRDSPFANSGLVVTVEPEDTIEWQPTHGVLAGVAYQKSLERTAKAAGNSGQVAPAQRVSDFMAGTKSGTLNPTSYYPGLNSCRLDHLLPRSIVWRMKQALKLFGQQMHGFVSAEAQMIGFETRTSSPVRIPRSEVRCENENIKGLFPCGEGAGFAGGIVSAALDGLRCAENVAQAN